MTASQLPKPSPADVAEVIDSFLAANDLPREDAGGTIVTVLPGSKKLKTNVALSLGPTHVTINAFVVRHPDENAEEFMRWLLRRNRRMFGVAYAVDQHGDVYLTGHMANVAVSHDELDRIFGSILENADQVFDTLLELGFESSIRREWEWRLSRGEPTWNLEAFRHLAPPVGELPPETEQTE